MCGVAGTLGPGSGVSGVGADMLGALTHRGPDARGLWSEDDGGVCLAHARLSIIDLAPTGGQPMHSADGRWVIAYNGEIYNHEALRRELDAAAPVAWRGHSDTEVLVELVARDGVEAALERVVGMFAFALWDRRERELVLVRDRFGEKPLYVRPGGERLAFASELGALLADPDTPRRTSRPALEAYLATGCVPAPLAMLEGVYKIEPGTLWRCRAGEVPRRARWWSPVRPAAAGLQAPFAGDDAEALDELERVLGDAVAGQMVSDVPLGAFLSGGIDSSLVVALMCRAGAGRVRTYSVGFDDPAYDEAVYAEAVASHLGTTHETLRVSADVAASRVSELGRAYSEPFADSSQLPMALVAEFARREVTVALSGDGGDELFCGYNRHRFAGLHWSRLVAVPIPLRRSLASAFAVLPPTAVERIAPWLPGLRGTSRPGERLQRGSAVIGATDLDSLHRELVSVWREPDAVLEPARAAPDALPDFLCGHLDPERESMLERLAPEAWMMLRDQLEYLPDDILVKVDRAAMACSLETRAPFLDHRVAEFAWSLPARMRLRGRHGKWLPRTLLARHVPPAMIERPKMGFSIPLHDMLRGSLRDWAAALLDPARIGAEGRFRPDVVARLWREHGDGRADHTRRLWALLMFQDWAERHGIRD